jgi:adenine-specific DNA glycosylase
LGNTSKQKKREIYYALDCRDGAVYLVQRAPDAQLMAGMWELPQLEATEKNKPAADFTLRHSITVTDYTVRVRRLPAPPNIPGQRIPLQKLQRYPLTGLARKILRKAELISGASISIPRLP